MSKIAVIGNGGREHALCWKLSESPRVSNVYAIPGNGGTPSDKVVNADVNANDFEALAQWCTRKSVNTVVVGPEVPLANGVANALTAKGIRCFGPSAEAARIEADKQWSKYFMDKYDIPTARWKSFVNVEDAKSFIESVPFEATVIKASGLAAGKGVVVAADKQEACEAVEEIMLTHKFGKAGNVIVVEERLEGEEVSVLAFCDGKTVKPMLPAQDHKRLLDGDNGPNTGGMGALCPSTFAEEDLEYVKKEILEKTVNGLAAEGAPFVGTLYAGLMVTADGIKVLEFNCRFGDPETQVLMPLLETDLYDVIDACCDGTLDKMNIRWNRSKYCVGIVMASEGYPDSVRTNEVISGLPSNAAADINGVHVFHAATAVKDGRVITTGGRVLNVVAVNESLPVSCAKAVYMCGKIKFSGCQYRTDIAFKQIPKNILKNGTITYQLAGVSISTGNDLIKNVKNLIESTHKESNISPIGSFGAIIDAAFKEYKHPLLVTGCDGVGTKLKIAQACDNHTSIGQDLVAMCVNDILAHGAKPLFFLDYFACGKLKPGIAGKVISGIVDGCNIAGCALVGGETAEMPGFYVHDEYDLAGFAVGVVDKEKMLPADNICEGDRIIYLPSSGVHSNGYSLVRKVLDDSGLSFQSRAPFSEEKRTFEEELLKPTRIYVKDLLPLIEKKLIKAFAHITGGGILENISRVIPSNLRIDLDASKWRIPAVFPWLAVTGGVNEHEMLRTFNCGIGGVVVVDRKHAKEVAAHLNSNEIGELSQRSGDEDQVSVTNFTAELGRLMMPYIPALIKSNSIPRKRVAVLISGTGTNLQALLESTTTDPESKARIVLVVSSKENVKGLEIAEQYGVPSVVLKRNKTLSLEVNDRPIQSIFLKENIDLVCLAGYMHILSDWFVSQWRGKMINVHPSLLPAFKGMHAQKQALEAGVKVAGCSVHFVETELDSGSIIEQAAVPVLGNDTVDSLVERIKQSEHIIYPKALKLLASEKAVLDLRTNKIIWK